MSCHVSAESMSPYAFRNLGSLAGTVCRCRAEAMDRFPRDTLRLIDIVAYGDWTRFAGLNRNDKLRARRPFERNARSDLAPARITGLNGLMLGCGEHPSARPCR